MLSQVTDQATFIALAERHRPELRVHCYRMLGSLHDAEDVVQETFLKAWHKRDSFEGRSSLRAWLYAIATHGCLDFIAAKRSALPPPEEIPWLEPFPDRLLEPAAPRDAEPDAVVIARETMELAYLVAIQFLPPTQRAVLILRDVLDWSAKDTAELLDLSVASVNSALQRGRETVREHRPSRRPDPAEEQRELLERVVSATERGDVRGLAELLREDVRFSMPPEPGVWVGRDEVVGTWVKGGFGSPSFGDVRCVVTRANGMPALACYLRGPGEAEYRPLALDVLRIEDGKIVEVTTFALEPFVKAFDLPPAL